MRIANVMFGRGLGGIEQSFLDYNAALLQAGHEVMAITHPMAAINPHIVGKVRHGGITNYGSWDWMAALRLRQIYQEWKPDAVISHGNRALLLNDKAIRNYTPRTSNVAFFSERSGGIGGLPPTHEVQKVSPSPDSSLFHIGVTHNYHLRHFGKLDAIFALTEDLRRAAGCYAPNPERIAIVPNMVSVPESLRKTPLASTQIGASLQPVPVIGAMGRFVEKKGFQHLLQAVSQLKQQGIPFRLQLGGGGALEKKLRQQARDLGLEEQVEFKGWIEDKASFFSGIDLFCLPSLHEPFGIVLLEALAHEVPVVAYASEGPMEIIRQEEALLVPLGDPVALAESLRQLLSQAELRQKLGRAGRDLILSRYSVAMISKQIDTALSLWLSHQIEH